MAHFYGEIKGAGGKTSRLGHKRSGLVTTAASWQGAVEVELYESDGEDYAHVRLKPWNNVGTARDLYNGPVGG